MKVFRKFISMIFAFVMTCVIMSCDRKITIESVVHPDGAIERTIVLTEVDSIELNRNIFGLRQRDGWEARIEPFTTKPNERVEKNTTPKYTIIFHKSFSSVEAANADLNSAGDTLFSIKAAFNKKFRWFYTYLDYSDTYLAINRFRQSKPEDFFTREDFDFIERLPAEGKSITKADSVYLDHLNKKIFDHFAMQAIYEEHFKLMLDVMQKARLEQKYIDSYTQQKEYMFSVLTKKENDNVFNDDAFMHQVMDSLHVTFPMDKIIDNYQQRSKEIKSRIDFMSEAGFASKYTHIIKMPWDVIETNADSVSGNTLLFQPPAIKFLLKDYTMHASGRRLNYWALIVSGLLIVVTIIAFLKKRSNGL